MKPKPPILGFQGKYRFLSNFYPCKVFLDGVRYRTVEHAYQASKFEDKKIRRQIKDCDSPSLAKHLARKLKKDTVPQTKRQRIWNMDRLLSQKFFHDLNPVLFRKLARTEGRELLEVNTWGDTFWGRCNGKGENQLGITLSNVREVVLRYKREKPEQE